MSKSGSQAKSEVIGDQPSGVAGSGSALLVRIGAICVIIPFSAMLLGTLLLKVAPECMCLKSSPCWECPLNRVANLLASWGMLGSLYALLFLFPIVLLAAIAQKFRAKEH
jgi:hypothetical protein